MDALNRETFFTYDHRGRAKTSHSDGTPAFSVNTRDRLGRALELLDQAAGTRTIEYTRHGAMESETITAGILAGQKLEQGFDSRLRSRSHTTSFGAQNLGETIYRYGLSGAIQSVSGNGNTAGYFYHPQKRTLQTVTYTKDGDTTPLLQSLRKHDLVNRLTRMTAHVNDAGVQKPVDHHAYEYDALDRIGSHADMTGAAWTYGYNATGEVTAATKKMPDGTTNLNGRDYRYHFDGIGNRTTVEQSRNGAQASRLFSYTPNALNQYSSVTHPDFVDISGTAASPATVTVNTQSVTPQGGYFYQEITEDNSSSPQWIDASITDGTTTTDGSLPLPAASTSPIYDDDGNLTSDSLWIYTWDASNRLIGCERSPAIVAAGAPYLREEHDYDYLGKRIRTSIFSTSTATIPSSQTLYIFDGWKCIAELDALSSNQAIRKYTWGLDLAGSIGDSSTGNIGALLWLVDSATNQAHIHLYDKNGNVSGLVNSTTRKKSATYDYDAFGQLTVCYGDYAKKNPFTFSTKFTDFATGLCYYGYRWYSPKGGRWPSRDPIEERGGVNLYGFVGNDGVNGVDVLGLDTYLLLWGDEQGVPFEQAAEGMKTKIEGSEKFDPVCDKAVVVGVKGFNDVQNALKENSDIQEIHFFVHSGPGIIYLNMTSTNADSNISINGGVHDITDYMNWGWFLDPIEFKSRGIRELDNSNMNKFKLFEWKERTSVHVHGCNSSYIASELGAHFNSFGYGVSGTCYFPVVDGVPVPATGLYYYWLLKTGKVKRE